MKEEMLKSLIMLLRCVLMDMSARCGTCTTRDFKTVMSRVEHEGLSFLTITLSTFGSDFQKSLDLGYVGHDRFAGFQRNGGLPRFLGGFLDLVFDRASGLLLPDPSIQAIYSIRQFTLMWSKMLIPCSDTRVENALKKYLECEQDLRQSDRRIASSEPDRLEEFDRIGRMLFADFLSKVDSRIYQEGVTPRHGPGATADKLRGNAKYNQRQWTSRMEAVFPHWENIIPSESFLDRTDDVRILEPRDEIPVKVITVPKTLKTPRIIAVEPTCMQYMQQGVLAVMMDEIPRSDNTRNFVMFESQEPNQRLAREGSLTGALATLDLSEASDRVSNQHVRLLVKNHRELRLAVDSTRSRKADVPGHGVIRLTKFASMGSALCFPFEALVFCTIVFVGISRALNEPLTSKDIKSFYGRVRIYGDDIIVPVEYVQSVVETLEAFGLRVNSDKSFWTGRFRESCGADFYAGKSVQIARLRRFLPTSRTDAEELASVVSFRNQMFHLGNLKTVDYLDEVIGKIIPFPYVEPTSPLLGRHTYSLPSLAEKVDPHLQIPLVKGAVLESKAPANSVDDSGALLKFFLKRSFDPLQEGHLQRSGRPDTARIKIRWASPV